MRRRGTGELGTLMIVLVAACAVRANILDMPQGLTSLETIDVGNIANGGELSGAGAGGAGPNRICGAVDYAYSMAKFEITAAQYVEFLNAVAATDSYGLYTTEMWSNDVGCKIDRQGTAGSYSYVVDPQWANRPVNYVTWGDAARFANWMHNGQPIGQQNSLTTEDGSYALNGATTDAELMTVSRQANATWVIPTEDEWYKSAYHENDGDTAHYYDFPTTADAIPGNQVDGGENRATYYDYLGGGETIGDPYYRTLVGAHINSLSPYGTFDMGGNVAEWNEENIYGSGRGLRGGSYDSFGPNDLRSSYRGYRSPTTASETVGFRLAVVPEPSILLLMAIAGLSLSAMRRTT